MVTIYMLHTIWTWDIIWTYTYYRVPTLGSTKKVGIGHLLFLLGIRRPNGSR